MIMENLTTWTNNNVITTTLFILEIKHIWIQDQVSVWSTDKKCLL